VNDSFPEGLVTVAITAIVNGATGEIGKQAWDSLTSLIHKAFKRNSPAKDRLGSIPATPDGTENVSRLVNIISMLAAEDSEFNEALNSWLMRAQYDLRLEVRNGGVSNIIESTHGAAVNSIIQARSIYGDLHIHENSTPVGTVTPRQLPLVSRYFVGRSAELGKLNELLCESDGNCMPPAIAAINGSGGIGKTALALHWAHREVGAFVDGQLFVDLCGYHSSRSPLESSEALQDFLDALGVSPANIPASVASKAALFRSIVARKKLLIILDNALDAEQIEPLLPGSSTCKTIVTSRNKLAEAVAEHGALSISLNLLSLAESFSMIVNRIGRVRVEAETYETGRLIELCARLPLALAIASAQLYLQPQNTIQSIVQDIESADSRVRGLASISSKDVNAVSASSYNKLNASAAMLFRFISLTPGPDISLYAAASLVGQPVPRTRQILTGLTQANLLEEQYPGRYQFHDLLREYAAEAVGVDSLVSKQTALDRYFNFYVRSAVEADRYLHPSRDPITVDPVLPGVTVRKVTSYDEAMNWFDSEQLTFINVIRMAAGESRWNSAWQLAWACSTYLDRKGKWQQWAITQEIALNAAQYLGDRSAGARSKRLLANIYDHLEQPSQALNYGEQALTSFRELGDTSGEARTLRTMSTIYLRLGSYQLAVEGARHALQIYRELGDDYGVANSLSALCAAEDSMGDYIVAQGHGEDAVGIFDDLGERYSLLVALRRLAHVHSARGQNESAIDYQIRALEASRALGNRYLEAALLEDLGDSYLAAGNLREARAALRQGLTCAQSIGAPNVRELAGKIADLDS
jgi:tetratricopeptide (TPR) repeat protein